MSSIGTGYDLSASTFSPVGRVFQVEYASKAIENSGTVIALRGKDGVVFAAENLVTSKLHEPRSTNRTFTVGQHIGVAVAGWIADGRMLVEEARGEARQWQRNYGTNITAKYLNERIAGLMHQYTLYGGARPAGACLMIGSYDELVGPQLYMAEPSGVSWGYYGCAMGKGKQAAQSEIEKLKLKELSMEQLVKEAARIIHMVHDSIKDKEFELELSWVGALTGGKHTRVPKEVFDIAENFAKDAMKEDDDD